MRSFDKIKNIQKANMLNESLYLVKKNPYYIVEGILAIDENDLENENIVNKFLFESMLECGFNLKEIVNETVYESEEVLTESVVVGTLLASGKLLDVIGVLFKKIYNYFVKKGWIKGQEINKTVLEKIGEFIHQKLIMGVFRVIATTLLGVIAAFVGAVSAFSGGDTSFVNNIVSEANINMLASTLFYVTIIVIGAKGLITVAQSVIHTEHLMHGVIEAVTSGTKLYEIILLILAFYSAMYVDVYKPFKNRIPDLAHAYGECLEGDKNIYNIIKTVPKKIKAGDAAQIECVNHHLNVHGEQGSDNNTKHE